MSSRPVVPARPPGDLDVRVERSADPYAARLALDRLFERYPEGLNHLSTATAADALVAVTAASRSLTRLLISDPAALDVVDDLSKRTPPPPGAIGDLMAWKRRELLRIAARDLVGADDLARTTSALSDMARDVLDACCDLAGASGLAVIGMGKLGGNELNYSSDVDVMFVGDGDPDELERVARTVMALAARCFRVDANLRPEGRQGKLVRTVDSYEAYWDRWAQPWEFQALVRSRPVAGDGALGSRFSAAAGRWLWSRPFGADDLRQLRRLKERSELEVTRRGLTDREIKRGPGGIRDIEFTAQLLQLVHGHLDPALRSPTTLEALRELARAGYVADDDARTLIDSYRFLRAVEHRLQLVDEQQTHTVPPEPEGRDHLARVLGLRSTAEASALEQFDRQLAGVQRQVRAIHERIYFRPLLEAFARTEVGLDEQVAATRLAAFGFTDAARTQAAIRELTRGLNRSSRLMQQMLPLMLDWLSGAPDPDLGLLVLRNLLTGERRRGLLVEAFRESPEVARQLCLLVGSSRLAGVTLARNPDLVPRLPYPERLRTRPRAELVLRALDVVAWRAEEHQRQEALHRWKDRNLLGIAARDLLYQAPVATVGHDLSTLAESTIEVALRTLDPQVPCAVIALGRLGGDSLSYASDLDIVFVYDGDDQPARDEGHRLAKGLLRLVNGTSPAERIFEIDTTLRPEGTQGAVARSLGAYRAYLDRWASLWERQAYLRARPVAGDDDVGTAFMNLVDPFVWADGLSRDDEREIRRTKARIEQERLPANEDARFHLKLGRGSLSDIEWTAQLLQLRHGIRATGTIEALTEVRDAGHLDPADAETLVTTYELLERTRNHHHLVSETSGDALPTQLDALVSLARSLGTTPTDLREDYRRVTRRTRRVVERVFYGRD